MYSSNLVPNLSIHLPTLGEYLRNVSMLPSQTLFLYTYGGNAPYLSVIMSLIHAI